MPADPAHAAARRKADLLMASALVREQAALALDDLDLRTRAWEDRARDLRLRAVAALGPVGRGLAGGQPAWVRPLAVAGLAAWLVARRRSRPEPDDAATARPGSFWAAGSLLLVNLPRLVRWSRRARLVWRLARLWPGPGVGGHRSRGPNPRHTGDSAKGRGPSKPRASR